MQKEKNQTPCRALLLPFVFSSERLMRDLECCLSEDWKAHFNTQDYSGDWNSISLYSVSGKTNDISTAGNGVFVPTPLMEKCAYFNEIISSLQCEKESVRLLRLAPGSVIKEHRDRKLAYEYDSFRLHIPIQTNSLIDFMVGGERLDMNGGECWYANFDLPHSVTNNSSIDRVHLVIDCIRNEWTDKLFAEAGYDLEADRKFREPDEETKNRIMEELLRMNSQRSLDLAREIAGGNNEQPS
ncbi:MAG TPA: aspartyl/asparaginyl beta-hydroxylase domain-containing protein [Bacteroidia bacterium]|nr:aspartyl/asparaginyl beta-hydroxylase domain-containing protein [Bacteroidia bacterium]